MTICTCAPKALPRGAKLKSVDDRPGSTGLPITETLYERGGVKMRVRVLERADSAKITISEAANTDGDVAEDERGGRIIFEQPMTGGAVVPLPPDPTARTAAIARAVEARLEAAARAGAMRHGVRRLLGLPALTAPTCADCGGEPPIKDATAEATHKDPNDLVVRSPTGRWIRLRFSRVTPPKNNLGEDSADWVHIMVSAAQAKDSSGDVVEDARGHRVFGGTVHSVPLHALVPRPDGRPGMSVEALIADRLATFALTQAEANIEQRNLLEAIPFFVPPPVEPPPLPPFPAPKPPEGDPHA